MRDQKSVALALEAGENPPQSRMEVRQAIFKLADGSLVRGKINLLAEPHHESEERFYNRISDLFTRGKNPFIVVFDAVVEGVPGQVLVINKKKVIWVSPKD